MRTRFLIFLALLLTACSSNSNSANESDTGEPGASDADTARDASESESDVSSGGPDGGGSNWDVGNLPEPGTIDALLDALLAYDVQTGSARPFRIADCETLATCFANNASSPYILVGLPPSPGAEYVPLDGAFGELPGFTEPVSPLWRLRADEVVIVVGTTPPPAAYFSFVPYIFDREAEDGTRATLFASLSDGVNHVQLERLGFEPFDGRFAMVISADPMGEDRGYIAERVARTVEYALAMDSVARINLPYDSLNTGVTEDADGISILGRVALFDDPMAGNAWLDAIESEWTVLRVTFKDPSDPYEPLDPVTPEREPRADGVDESEFEADLDALEAAIEAAHGEENLTTVSMSSAQLIDTIINPETCLQNLSNCLGDNGDTTYSAGPIDVLTGGDGVPMTSDGFFVAFGVDHEATGNAEYANAVINWAARQAGVGAVDSRSWQGSAGHYLGDDADGLPLFAWRFARTCGDAPFCTEVPETFPGIPDGDAPLFIFRAYLSPGGTVATDPSFLVTPRVFWVEGEL